MFGISVIIDGHIYEFSFWVSHIEYFKTVNNLGIKKSRAIFICFEKDAESIFISYGSNK